MEKTRTKALIGMSGMLVAGAVLVMLPKSVTSKFIHREKPNTTVPQIDYVVSAGDMTCREKDGETCSDTLRVKLELEWTPEVAEFVRKQAQVIQP